MNPCRIIAFTVAVSIAWGCGIAPAVAGGTGALPAPGESGLITTERVAAAAPVAGASDRAALVSALARAGVDDAQARERVAALTDAEIAELARALHSAPAGGVWFVPFLVVAAVIGALIGTREGGEPGAKPTTNLFGQPRIAAAP
jgi:hypothetical protein